MGQSWSRFRQRGNARTLLELAPKKTPGAEEPLLPALDRRVLMAALTDVGNYIAANRASVTVIAIGGAVNTIHLQSRPATHDVDFFNNRLTPADAAGSNRHLSEGWFNNRTVFFIPNDRRDTLTNEAFAQNEVIFRHGGLTVLAAPWHYAFCCKVDRLAGGGINPAQSYDLGDAVGYLRRYLGKHRVAQVGKSTVRGWFAQYLLRWTANNDNVIARVNAAYRQKYQVDYDPISNA